MLVAVITPCCKEPLELLARCHRSERQQTHRPALHVMVADGFPGPEIDAWDVLHLKLPHCSDSNDTPRAVAGLVAANRGADALTMLDADNLFEPDHIECLLGLQRASPVHVVTARFSGESHERLISYQEYIALAQRTSVGASA